MDYKKAVGYTDVGTYGDDDIKKIVGKKLIFSKQKSSCFGDDISYLNDTVKNPTYKKSLITADEFAADFDNTDMSTIGIKSNTITMIEVYDTDNYPACTFFIKDDNSLIIYGGGTFFELSRVTQDIDPANNPTPTPFTASSSSDQYNTANNNDKLSDNSINRSVDNYLRCENENVLFSFKIANSRKSASICISKNQQDYIIYRYGTKDKIELEYPIKAESSWNKFTYSYYMRGGGTDNEGLDLNYLNFDNGGYSYEIYEEYGSESNKPKVGIKVTNRKTGKVTDIVGDSDSIKGSLISLRDNTKINIITQ